MGFHGVLWGPMGPMGTYVPYGDLWVLWGPMGLMGTYGSYRDLCGGPMGSFGDLWHPLASYGDLWHHLGIYGVLMGSMGVPDSREAISSRIST